MTDLRKSYIVFDLDDTLTDSRQFCANVIVDTIQACHKDITREAILALHERMMGQSIADIYKKAITAFNLHTPLTTLLALDRARQLREIDRMPLFEGAARLVLTLAGSGKHLSICTNRKAESLLPILSGTGILPYFDPVVSCADAGHPKPDPTCLVDLMTHSRQDPSTVLYVGDSTIDAEFASRAGVDCLIVNQYQNGKALYVHLVDLFAPI